MGLEARPDLALPVRPAPPFRGGAAVNGDPAQTVLDALERAGSKVRGRAGRWMARCPAHDDRNPSLSIMEFGDGNVWGNCFAGCETEAVLDRLGLRFPDLFARRLPAAAGPNVVPGKELPPEWAREIRRVEFAVLDVLLEHAFNGPTCKPSQALIAAELRDKHGWHTTRETVNRACAWLRQYGFIDWHQERAPGAKWRHNVYRLQCTWVRPLRLKLLKRLDHIRNLSRTTNHLSTLPVAFSVIRPHEHHRDGLGEPGLGLVEAQHARAGPMTRPAAASRSRQPASSREPRCSIRWAQPIEFCLCVVQLVSALPMCSILARRGMLRCVVGGSASGAAIGSRPTNGCRRRCTWPRRRGPPHDADQGQPTAHPIRARGARPTTPASRRRAGCRARATGPP